MSDALTTAPPRYLILKNTNWSAFALLQFNRSLQGLPVLSQSVIHVFADRWRQFGCSRSNVYCVIWSCGTVSTTTVTGDDLDTTVVKARCQPRNPSDVLNGRLNKVFDVLNADYFTALSDLVKRTA